MDNPVEVILVSTHLEVGGVWVEALEWVAESLRGFFSEVPVYSTFSFLCLFSFFLTILTFIMVGCKEPTYWLTL